MDARVLERFWRRVDKTDSCWLWTGALCTGYGDFYYQGRDWRSHRFSYVAFKGEIPEGMLVCHTCDNKRCVNPEHLYLGNYFTNAEDAFNRGQNGLGEKHPNAKLTNRQVDEIRQLASTTTYVALARQYGVVPYTISSIVKRKHRIREVL
jgi:hypothetical protein